MTRTGQIAFALAVCALALASCGGDEGSQRPDSADRGPAGKAALRLTIGELAPLSGELSDFGPPGEKAAGVAVVQIKKAIDEVGADHEVALKTADDESSDRSAVAAARTLVGDGAGCLVGSWAPSASLLVARSVSIPEGVLQISPASSTDELTSLDDAGLVNRTVAPDSFQGPALADAIAEDLGGAKDKTVNVGARDDLYGNGIAGTFAEGWEARGGRIGELVTHDRESRSFDAEAERLVSGEPDATVLIDFPQGFAKLGPALARTGDYDPSLTWATDALAATSLPKDVGVTITEGLRGLTPGVPDDAEPTKEFTELFESSPPEDVESHTFDAQAFDSTILCYLAAVGAGSTEGAEMAGVVQSISSPPGDSHTFEQLPEAIKALEHGKDIDYQGASGAIDLDNAGDTTAGVYDVYEYDGEDLELVDEIPVDSGKE
jgi:ABC-type branched-subunit amino acid transport system substrate-binding protein